MRLTVRDQEKRKLERRSSPVIPIPQKGHAGKSCSKDIPQYDLHRHSFSQQYECSLLVPRDGVRQLSA